MNLSHMRKIFLELANELQAVIQDKPAEPVIIRNPTLLIRGGLVLEGGIAHSYMRALTQMAPSPRTDEPWSEKTVDQALSITLEQLIATGDTSAGGRNRAADAFIARIRKEPVNYDVSFSVFGVNLDCAGAKFGRVTLELGSFTSNITFPGIITSGEPHETLFAKVSVRATDQDTAELRAAALVDQHLNVLNALCSGSPPSYIRLSRKYAGSHSVGVIRVTEGSQTEVNERFLSSIQRRLLSRSELERRLATFTEGKLNAMLREGNAFYRRVIAALEIAGAACIEEDNHEAFLLFAIALESAILGRDTQSELTFQLATRTAYLLTTTLSARREVVKSVKRLYGLRSKIVHTGATSVRPESVKEIRFICLNSLFSLIQEMAFAHFQTTAELDSWFEEQALGAGPNDSVS